MKNNIIRTIMYAIASIIIIFATHYFMVTIFLKFFFNIWLIFEVLWIVMFVCELILFGYILKYKICNGKKDKLNLFIYIVALISTNIIIVIITVIGYRLGYLPTEQAHIVSRITLTESTWHGPFQFIVFELVEDINIISYTVIPKVIISILIIVNVTIGFYYDKILSKFKTIKK